MCESPDRVDPSANYFPLTGRDLPSGAGPGSHCAVVRARCNESFGSVLEANQHATRHEERRRLDDTHEQPGADRRPNAHAIATAASPIIDQVRSVVVVPQLTNQRRIGSQYSTASASTRSDPAIVASLASQNTLMATHYGSSEREISERVREQCLRSGAPA